jgi:hypothetical protein
MDLLIEILKSTSPNLFNLELITFSLRLSLLCISSISIKMQIIHSNILKSRTLLGKSANNLRECMDNL